MSNERTPAQKEASARNGKKSRGANSVEGKKRSSRNALKHGMTAEILLLDSENPQEFRKHINEWVDDFRPQTAAQRFLVERAAANAWRCNRCTRNRQKHQALRYQKEAREYDQKAVKLADAAFEKIWNEAPDAMTELENIHGGPDQLIELIEDFFNDIQNPIENLAANMPGDFMVLLGLTAEFAREDAYKGHEEDERFTKLLLTKQQLLSLVHDLKCLIWHFCSRPIFEWPKPDDDFSEHATKSRLDRVEHIVRRRVEWLKIRAEHLSDRHSARRADLAEMYALEPTKEDQLRHRYETSFERSVRSDLRILMQLDRTGIDTFGLEPETPEPPVEPPVVPEAPPVVAEVPAAPVAETPALRNEPEPPAPESSKLRNEPEPRPIHRPISEIPRGFTVEQAARFLIGRRSFNPNTPD